MTALRRVPRWFKVAGGVIAGLFVLLHLVGGFVFSNMIRADALTPEAPSPDNGIYVLGMEDNSITITSAEKRADSVHRGTFGLAWDGGYGRIGKILEVEGLIATREFELVSGTPPPVCSGDLAGCNEVDIEGWAFENDPSDNGVKYENVSYSSPLGVMKAWKVKAGDGLVWAIHVHGWRSSKREAIRTLPSFQEAGITSLVIDYRNDPNAPADPSGLYRFGQTEWEDVDAAVSYALENGASEIILVGYSTGAAVHAAYMEKGQDTERVTAAVFDSPNLDMGGIVKSAASDRNIPGTPIPVPPTITWTAMRMADIRFGVDWTSIDYAARADNIFTIPTLVFHGTADTRVPVEQTKMVAESASEVRFIETPGAGHVTSWNADPHAYERSLATFLDGQASATSTTVAPVIVTTPTDASTTTTRPIPPAPSVGSEFSEAKNRWLTSLRDIETAVIEADTGWVPWTREFDDEDLVRLQGELCSAASSVGDIGIENSPGWLQDHPVVEEIENMLNELALASQNQLDYSTEVVLPQMLLHELCGELQPSYQPQRLLEVLNQETVTVLVDGVAVTPSSPEGEVYEDVRASVFATCTNIDNRPPGTIAVMLLESVFESDDSLSVILTVASMRTAASYVCPGRASEVISQWADAGYPMP